MHIYMYNKHSDFGLDEEGDVKERTIIDDSRSNLFGNQHGAPPQPGNRYSLPMQSLGIYL
jgi:hypothetical protein